MTKKSITIISLATILLLAGCASKTPAEIEIPKEKKYSADSIDVHTFSHRGTKYDNIREITRGHTAGMAAARTGLVAMQILSVLAGNVGVFVGPSGYGFTKEQLIGSEIKDAQDTARVKNPAFDLGDALKKEINLKKKSNPALASTMYEYPISISNNGNTWKLTYESLSGDNNKSYVLNSDLAITRYIVERKDENATRVQNSENCSYKSAPIAYEKWKADDYKLIGETKQIIIENCIKQISPKLDKFVPVPVASKTVVKK